MEWGYTELPQSSHRHRKAEHLAMSGAPERMLGLQKAQLENQGLSLTPIFQMWKLRPGEGLTTKVTQLGTDLELNPRHLVSVWLHWDFPPHHPDCPPCSFSVGSRDGRETCGCDLVKCPASSPSQGIEHGSQKPRGQAWVGCSGSRPGNTVSCSLSFN